MSVTNLWTEKYRPSTLDGYVFKDNAQKEQIESWIKKQEIPHLLFSGSAGIGKAQPLTAKIKIPGGWKQIGSIRIGDYVSSPDGKTVAVTGVFPQGKKDIYQFEFADGRTAESCLEHLWKVWDHGQQQWRIMQTSMIIDQLNNTKKNFYIPLLSLDEQQTAVNLPLDPYFLGCMLGGGCLSNNFNISTNDQEIVDSIQAVLVEGYELSKKTTSKFEYNIRRTKLNQSNCGSASRKGTFRNIYKQIFSDLELLGCNSFNKFIPKEYKNSSHAQKEQLLAGLIDTDGYVNAQGAISISTSSSILSNDIAEVVRSIGGIAKITSKIPSYTYKGEKKSGSINYNISIRYPEPTRLSKLARKLSRIPTDYQYKDLKLKIKSIKLIGSGECVCIMVDHPDHLYLTDNFVVTHNTTLAKILINALDIDEFDLKEINASRENSVDHMRDVIVNFVSTMPFGKFKVVLLDEADYLSPNAQAILRGVMETYHETARFILTCNYPNKIIPALHSRCQGFHFEKIDHTEFTARVATVLVTEGVEFELDTLDDFVRTTYPDLRKCLNTCQMHSVDGKLVLAAANKSSADYKLGMVELFKKGKIREARQLICSQARPEEMDDLFRWCYDNLDLWSDTPEGQDDAIIIIRQGLVNHALVADPEINVSAMLCELAAINRK